MTEKLLERFSLITVGENKIPNFPWIKLQTKKLDQKEFSRRLNLTSDKEYTRKDGSKGLFKGTKGVGLVTGYADVEVIDIDLKVFKTAPERNEFINELFEILESVISDFNKKFVVYGTQNNGVHILYQSKLVQGNQKLSVLKGHTEAVIETRGKGGYVMLYPKKKISQKDYLGISYISDTDRNALISICRSFDYIEEEKPKIKKGGITPWEEFNQQNSVMDVVGDEFDIVKETASKTFVKRKGGTTPHSGYIFSNSGCLFLFTSGTSYPYFDGTEASKKDAVLSPFKLYAHKYHNGDFSKATKDLYEQGFGDRIEFEKPKQDKKWEVKQEEQFPFEKLLEQSTVNLFEDVPRPDTIISIGEHEYKGKKYPNATMTGGEFSVIAAPSKARKSFFKSALAAAYIGGNSHLYFPNLIGHRQGEHSVIDIDTEQSEYYAQRTFRRVPEMVGSSYENYYPFRMRFMSVQERVKFIDKLLYSGRIKDPKLMFIDGIADLIEDTNDLVMSNEIVGTLMKWTDDFKMHICTIIHTAYETHKPTGHLGSAVTKKAESVFSLTKEGDNTAVEHSYSRGYAFDPFVFTVEDSIPKLLNSGWHKPEKIENLF